MEQHADFSISVIRQMWKSNEPFFMFSFCSLKLSLLCTAATCIQHTSWSASPFFHHLKLAFLNARKNPDFSFSFTQNFSINTKRFRERIERTSQTTKNEKLNINSPSDECTSVYWHHSYLIIKCKCKTKFLTEWEKLFELKLKPEMIKNNWRQFRWLKSNNRKRERSERI